MKSLHAASLRIALISGAVGALLAGGTVWTLAGGTRHATPLGVTAAHAAAPHHAARAGTGQHVVGAADVVERAMQSVVSVKATKVTPAATRGPWQGLLPFPFGIPESPHQQQGLGSGVVVRADGIVLTNHHVVDGAKELTVTTAENRELSAEVLGSDAKSDLAVLRIKDSNHALKPIAIGTSAALRLGEPVLAIGNPFGVGQTVTQGIVSAKGRANLGINAYEDFIQTDAAINPGNSGGALVNMRGELVGINTAILSRSGGNVGIGFAIPTDMARPIMQSLISKGRVDRGWLGVTIQDIGGDLGDALKVKPHAGVLVADVGPGSPAARGGVKRGDIITRVNEAPVATTGELRNAIALAGAHQQVRLSVLRDGQQQSLTLTLGTAPDGGDSKGSATPSSGGGRAGSLDGLTVEPLEDTWRQRLGVPHTLRHGVVVTQVDPGSPADKTGLQPGDIIMEVDHAPIASLKQFAQKWKSVGGHKLLLLVRRAGRPIFLATRR